MSWPDYDSSWNPYFGDGVTYGRELGRISPEGNIYGQMRFVREWKHMVWWTGAEWKDYNAAGQLESVDELPTGRQTFGLIYEVKEYREKENTYFWTGYFYNSENPSDPWQKMRLMWDVSAYSDLPIPGVQVGAVQRVIETDVLIVWTGYYWERLKHSVLDNDEKELHLPPGFLDLLIPDVRVLYVNQYELVLEAVEGGSGAVFVGGDLILASPDTAVFSDTKALNLSGSTLTEADLQADTEYWIYLANTQSIAFNLNDWDYRGKLFLSTTTPVNGYLGSGIGQNARLAGRIQTDGDGYFARELDISLISNRASLTDAFRDFSDFVIQFIDESTLRLAKLDGSYGQIFLPDSLRYIGFDYDINRTDDWVNWDDDMEDKVELLSLSILPNATYYIYMAGMIDPFNFNELNPETGRPWQESDFDAENNYVPSLDLRAKPFLSPKEPDHGRMSETWPGFYTRWIGTVHTDGNAKFINARDLSNIRQPTLNPTYFDGLAEITFAYYGGDEFRIAAIQGTSGIINVGGSAVQTYPKDQTGDVHQLFTTDKVQDYDEEDLETPLSDLNAVSTYTDSTLYLYMANSRTHWGSFQNKAFFCQDAPTGGYLSQNWPGNQARWIATVYVNDDGEFGAGYLKDSVVPLAVHIDDSSSSPTVVWSAEKIAAEINALWFEINITQQYENQKENGCPLQLEYVDSSTIKISPTVESYTAVFPDSTYLEIGSSGVSLSLTGLGISHGTIYYVWLDDTGLYLNTTPPTNTYDKLEDNGTDAILVGWLSPSASNAIAGTWNVYSYWNEPEREWSELIDDYYEDSDTINDVVLDMDGFFMPTGKTGIVSRTGASEARGVYWNPGYQVYGTTPPVVIGYSEKSFYVGATYIGKLTLTISSSHSTLSSGTVYDAFTLTHEKYMYYSPGWNKNSWYHSWTGVYKVTREGT